VGGGGSTTPSVPTEPGTYAVTRAPPTPASVPSVTVLPTATGEATAAGGAKGGRGVGANGSNGRRVGLGDEPLEAKRQQEGDANLLSAAQVTPPPPPTWYCDSHLWDVGWRVAGLLVEAV